MHMFFVYNFILKRTCCLALGSKTWVYFIQQTYSNNRFLANSSGTRYYFRYLPSDALMFSANTYRKQNSLLLWQIRQLKSNVEIFSSTVAHVIAWPFCQHHLDNVYNKYKHWSHSEWLSCDIIKSLSKSYCSWDYKSLAFFILYEKIIKFSYQY